MLILKHRERRIFFGVITTPVDDTEEISCVASHEKQPEQVPPLLNIVIRIPCFITLSRTFYNGAFLVKGSYSRSPTCHMANAADENQAKQFVVDMMQEDNAIPLPDELSYEAEYTTEDIDKRVTRSQLTDLSTGGWNTEAPFRNAVFRSFVEAKLRKKRNFTNDEIDKMACVCLKCDGKYHLHVRKEATLTQFPNGPQSCMRSSGRMDISFGVHISEKEGTCDGHWDKGAAVPSSLILVVIEVKMDAPGDPAWKSNENQLICYLVHCVARHTRQDLHWDMRKFAGLLVSPKAGELIVVDAQEAFLKWRYRKAHGAAGINAHNDPDKKSGSAESALLRSLTSYVAFAFRRFDEFTKRPPSPVNLETIPWIPEVDGTRHVVFGPNHAMFYEVDSMTHVEQVLRKRQYKPQLKQVVYRGKALLKWVSPFVEEGCGRSTLRMLSFLTDCHPMFKTALANTYLLFWKGPHGDRLIVMKPTGKSLNHLNGD